MMRKTVCLPTTAAAISTAAATAAATVVALALATQPVWADETCNSPYLAKLIKGQEDFLHVWTLGVEGQGDGRDKLVTIAVNPASRQYGKVVHQVSVPGKRGEAHHMGFTDDRRYLWAGGLDDSRIHIFDVGRNPARPRLVKTLAHFAQQTGYVGPHTFYAMPGRMLVAGLSNSKDKGGVTGLATFNNAGKLIARHDLPTTEIGGVKGDGYGYDIAINPGRNAMLTSSFTGHANYMRPLGELIKDGEAMKNFGNTMVLWDLKAMQPQQVFSVPGAPLEIRWSLNPGDNWAITATALTSKLWLIKPGAPGAPGTGGAWQAKEVATIGDPAKIPLPVDISITADGKGLWVNTFMDGMTRYFDLSNPEAPKETYAKQTGKQVNMISQSWDGKRVYVTSSLLEKWDKGGADNEQFVRAFQWDGKELKPAFEVDFAKLGLGRAHHMKFSAKPSGKSLAEAAAMKLALARPGHSPSQQP